MKFETLIKRKNNAESYKMQIDVIQKEIEELKSKISMTMFEEEKNTLLLDKKNKEKELTELSNSYSDKRTSIEDEIEKKREELLKEIEERERKAISRDDYEKILKEKSEKEQDLKDCSAKIDDLQFKINEVVKKSEEFGYDLDVASLAKKLEEQVAYKTYLNEEMNELNQKISSSIIKEDNLEMLKDDYYRKIRLQDLSYDNLEKWYEKDKEELSKNGKNNEKQEIDMVKEINQDEKTIETEDDNKILTDKEENDKYVKTSSNIEKQNEPIEENKPTNEETKSKKQDYKEAPGVPKTEENITVNAEEDKNIYSNSYETNLDEYKNMLEIYNEHVNDYADYTYTQYLNGEIPYSEYEKVGLGLAQEYKTMKEAYKKIKDRYDIESKRNVKANNEKNIPLNKWPINISQELIDDAISRDIYEPEGQEWEMFLKEHGIDSTKLEYAKAEKVNEENKKSAWHSELTEEQIEELKAENIRPGDNEYRQYLLEHGINPKEKSEKEVENNKIEKPEEPIKPGMVMEKENEEGKVPPRENNLPIKSGLQVYNQVLQEVGNIKGRKAIAAHDFLNKFGLIGKLGAWGIRILTGRKKEIKRIEEILDDLPEEDLNLMMDDCLTKNNDSRPIIDYKVNDIFLRALGNKLERERTGQDPKLAEREQELKEALKEQREKLSKVTSEEEKVNINKLINAISNDKEFIHDKRIGLRRRKELVDQGRDLKSYDKKDNIKGGTRADRNPDNREEIKELASIEQIKLKAENEGDKTKAAIAKDKMEDYMGSKTIYKFGLNGKIKASIGAFESPTCKVELLSQQRNMTPEILHALTVAGIISLKQFTDFMNQQNLINSQINVVNGKSGQQISDLKGMANSSTIDTAKSTLNKDALDVQIGGERTSSFVGNFRADSSAYRESDANMISISDKTIADIKNFKPSGNSSWEKLASIFQKKSEIGESGGKQVAEALEKAATGYYSNPGHIVSGAGVDHAATSAIERAAGSINNDNAELNSLMANVCKKIGELTPNLINNIRLNLKPLLLTLVPTASKVTQEAIEEKGKKTQETNNKSNEENGQR